MVPGLSRFLTCYVLHDYATARTNDQKIAYACEDVLRREEIMIQSDTLRTTNFGRDRMASGTRYFSQFDYPCINSSFLLY